MKTLKLAQPPGIRSTGGIHHLYDVAATGEQEYPDFLVDLDEFCSHYSIEEFSRTIRTELLATVGKALEGTLTYQSEGRAKSGTVCKIASQPGVLEARLEGTASAEKRLHVRLFFSEPETVDALILVLGTLLKEDYPIGKCQQNQHASVCQQRGDEWLTNLEKSC